MSIFNGTPSIPSILKVYSPTDRDKTKKAIFNSIRFEIPKEMGMLGAIKAVKEKQIYGPYREFVLYLQEAQLSDKDFERIICEARQCVHLLDPSFYKIAETLLSLNWTERDEESINAYTEFYVELLVAHSEYTDFAITRLVAQLIPNERKPDDWPNSIPVPSIHRQLKMVHNLLERLLLVIPMTYDIVLNSIAKTFPYYKRPTHVIGGFIHNILWLLEYKPSLSEFILKLIFKKMLVLDVFAPRNLIEESELDETENEPDIFQTDVGNNTNCENQMSHPIAETLDICMEKMFSFMEKCTSQKCTSPESIKLCQNEPNSVSKPLSTISLFKYILYAFDDVILPSHNTHHVQFLLFYFCNFRSSLTEQFLASLWSKVKDPNTSASIRQASVGYIASFLARSKYVSINLIKNYIQELCHWAHLYIKRSDSIRCHISLKSNSVFFSVCQAVFYIIAFRSRDLTKDKKSLLFLQSLQLSALVTCNFNPLRVCLPAIATTFAGVTRTYQLAYCYTILERNACRKLATVYGNETTKSEEETFFPFDSYLLKKSGERITPLFLQYKADEAKEESQLINKSRRKRSDSETIEDDDFIYIDKKLKFSEVPKIDKDIQCTYSVSLGYHI